MNIGGYNIHYLEGFAPMCPSLTNLVRCGKYRLTSWLPWADLKHEGKIADLRKQKIEQTPELLQLILQRGSSQQQAPQGSEPVQVLSQLALPVLHALCLVNDHILPLNLHCQVQPLEGEMASVQA